MDRFIASGQVAYRLPPLGAVSRLDKFKPKEILKWVKLPTKTLFGPSKTESSMPYKQPSKTMCVKQYKKCV